MTPPQVRPRFADHVCADFNLRARARTRPPVPQRPPACLRRLRRGAPLEGVPNEVGTTGQTRTPIPPDKGSKGRYGTGHWADTHDRPGASQGTMSRKAGTRTGPEGPMNEPFIVQVQ